MSIAFKHSFLNRPFCVIHHSTFVIAHARTPIKFTLRSKTMHLMRSMNHKLQNPRVMNHLVTAVISGSLLVVIVKSYQYSFSSDQHSDHDFPDKNSNKPNDSTFFGRETYKKYENVQNNQLDELLQTPYTVYEEFKAERETKTEKFEPTAESLSSHKIPNWWRDGKLGIFIHWGLYSVPGFAPVDHMFQEDVPREIHVKYNPYAEWYMNTMRYENSPTKSFHEKTFKNREYMSFVKEFNEGIVKWDPQYWASVFKSIGASYSGSVLIS